MRFDIITIFPKLVESYFGATILARAQRKKLIDIRIHDLRKYARKGDPHRSVDDRPYGGGPGMILKVEPIFKALHALRIHPPYPPLYKGGKEGGSPSLRRRGMGRLPTSRVVMLSPDGKRFTQRDAERLAKYKRLVLLCGRYEGFDARTELLVDEKISIGDFMLAGGELPAMMIVEAVSRHIPGVVGHPDALKEETFSKNLKYKEYPQYTRPEVFYPTPPPSPPYKGGENKKNSPPYKGGGRGGNAPPLVRGGRRGGKRRKKAGFPSLPRRGGGRLRDGWRVPKILLSGNHKKIQEWREKNSHR